MLSSFTAVTAAPLSIKMGDFEEEREPVERCVFIRSICSCSVSECSRAAVLTKPPLRPRIGGASRRALLSSSISFFGSAFAREVISLAETLPLRAIKRRAAAFVRAVKQMPGLFLADLGRRADKRACKEVSLVERRALCDLDLRSDVSFAESSWASSAMICEARLTSILSTSGAEGFLASSELADEATDDDFPISFPSGEPVHAGLEP